MTVTITTVDGPVQGPQFTQAAAEPHNRPRVRVDGDWTPGTGPKVYEPPSLAEQRRAVALAEQRRLDAHRPADRSPAAVQRALDAVVADLAVAETRLAAARDAAGDMTGTPGDVKARRDAAELLGIEVEQLTGMASGLRTSLADAHAAEAEELKILTAAASDAATVVGRFRQFIERDYPKHAAAIGRGMALEREAEAAMGTLRAAAVRLGHDEPEPLPRVRNGLVTEAHRFRVCLPGTDVRPSAV